MSAIADLVSPFLDLVSAPFTLPRSRILVLAHHGGLRVCLAEYEQPLDDSVVFERLSVADADGTGLPVTAVRPHRIEFGGGQVTLTFAGPHALSIGVRAGSVAELNLTRPDGELARLRLGAGQPAAVRLTMAANRSAEVCRSAAHEDDEHATEAIWASWLDRCPLVRGDLQAMTALCWWVLGANIVELPGQGSARVVVPSKIGYVGLWQWDAYFIAVGLRHGDIELAREQLDLAFRFSGEDGQLPDVVHDQGILASSDDLPEHDRATLRRHGSSVADPRVPVRLTKPPLAAWALAKVLELAPADAWSDAAYDTVARSQDWWFDCSDSDGDGMPEYGHPYSSGLDDSPIFDGPLPLASPDLGAYLVVQDRELAKHFTKRGKTEQATRHGDRAAATLARLLELWDADAGQFTARGGTEIIRSLTAVSLLPLLTAELPSDIAATILGALNDPERFGTPWPVPTVATGDRDFSPERMWRGPVWVNVNALIVDGLRRSGHHAEATELAERTVALVIHGGGPHEYFNPFTGEKAQTATTSFGWSAALFIDLAVQLS